jgi:glycosyltransferase involved in cell wall biosynthesis
VGDGPLAGKLDADLVGRLTPDELAALRRRAAVVLVLSRSDESFGLSALEAMGAGVPVIATRMGALPELVGEEHCVARDDIAAMADRVRALWADPARRKAVGDELIARVRERFTGERFTRDLLDLYSRVQAS